MLQGGLNKKEQKIANISHLPFRSTASLIRRYTYKAKKKKKKRSNVYYKCDLSCVREMLTADCVETPSGLLFNLVIK
jgi:hypothetical protein